MWGVYIKSQGSFLGGSNFVEGGFLFLEGLTFVGGGEGNNKTWGYYRQVSKHMRIRIFDHAYRLGSKVIFKFFSVLYLELSTELLYHHE